MMSNTIYSIVKTRTKGPLWSRSTRSSGEVQAYVPGYSLRVPPIVDGNKVTVIVQVEGLEIFCPNTPETSISSTLLRWPPRKRWPPGCGRRASEP